MLNMVENNFQNIVEEMAAAMKKEGVDDPSMVPLVIGLVTQEMMKMSEKERKQLEKDFKDPKFQRGMMFGYKLGVAIISGLMDHEVAKL